ncbi:BRE1 E3 ubiquitin ligase family protein [Leishmania donovani]|uniref:BRE1 E3 ubiquitin ligase family protein n=1 Tax=Leishmania donovani TaxID=5661 RepID=A0A504YD63_LEIDO|nr:BRE1 E3 ubiquitin ligase family protein [Leishmania donovani]
MRSPNDSVAYESDSDVSEMDPESDVLAPVQRRIEEQLRKHLQELSQQIHETNNELSGVEKERESCGVDLYNAQQHLATLQKTLEGYHEKHAAIQQQHEDKLRAREELSSAAESAQKKVDDMQKQYTRYHNELAKLTETLMKVERFNQELKDEVELERRAAHKTEDDITNLEKAKLRQDSLILSMQKRIETLENESAMLDEQIGSQREETKRARETLADAASEMEAIVMEKKQLVQQWRSSLIGMQRRQDAVRKTEEALQQQKNELLVLENEITGYRHDIRTSQAENTKLTAFMSRIDNEIIILERQMDGLLLKKEEATKAYALLEQSIASSVEERKAVEQKMKLKAAELSEVEKQIAKHAKAIVEMENEMLVHLSRESTLKQESKGALQEIRKIKESIRAKEQKVTQMENELARIRVDTLQSKAYNETLATTLADLEKELQSRSAMIEKMQADIRRRNNEIDRKQNQLDQLNHQYEQILAAHNDLQGDHVGPLEATINSLSRAIATKSSENEALQQEWIRLQTELVNYKNNMNDINEAILDAQAKATILKQKKDRLLANISEGKQQVTNLQNKSNAMHLEMKRVNTLLSQNNGAQQSASDDVFFLEKDLVRRLEERKREAIQLEKKVEDMRQSKSDIVEQILSCERDIMFWERKLQVARETEMALDPTIGCAEMEKMKKEITFMEQRMSQLQREQKFLIEEMQKMIDHRDIIRTKGKAIQIASQKNKNGVTRLAVEKENMRLFKELNAKRQESRRKEKLVKESMAEMDRIAADVDRTQHEIQNLDAQIEDLQGQIAAAKKERNRAEDEKRLRQNNLQRLRDAEVGAYRLMCYPEEAATEAARLDEGRRAVVNIMEELSAQFPDLAPSLQDLMTSV